MALGQWAVERDAGAERLDRLVARVGKGRRRLEADPRSSIAEGKVGRVVELERSSQVEASTRSDHRLSVDVRRSESGREVNTSAVGTRAYRLR